MKQNSIIKYNDKLYTKITCGFRSTEEYKKERALEELMLQYSRIAYNSYENEMLLSDIMAYVSELGYVILSEAGMDSFNLEQYGHDTSTAFKEILMEHLMYQGEIEEERRQKENIPFDFDTYAIEKIKLLYEGNIPESDIEFYTSYLNEIPQVITTHKPDSKRKILSKIKRSK